MYVVCPCGNTLGQLGGGLFSMQVRCGRPSHEKRRIRISVASDFEMGCEKCGKVLVVPASPLRLDPSLFSSQAFARLVPETDVRTGHSAPVYAST